MHIVSPVNRTAVLSRSATCRAAGVARVRVAPGLRTNHHLHRISIISRVAEETTESVQADASASSEAPEVEALSPMQRAKKVLDAEVLDKATLEAALADLEAEMVSLQDSVAAADSRALSFEATAATAKDQLLRLNADFENFRRRTQSEKEQLADSVRGDVVVSLLPVVDNFELARTQVVAETEGEQKINASYQGLYKQFVDFLRGLNVEAVPTVGTAFDPNIHEAIMKEANNEVPDETVLMEFRKGFKLGDKLLRAAMVKVSINDGTPPPQEE